jgi:hypothetical protein
LQLGEVAEIEAQKFSFAQKFNRRTTAEFSTKPAILPNCCYKLAFFSVWLFVNCSAYIFVGIVRIFVVVETLSNTPVLIIAFANISITGTETLLPN